MNNKKFFGTALSALFAFGLLFGATNFTSVQNTTTPHQHNVRKDGAGYTDSSFHAVNIGRDELTVDVQSLTSTSTSKSATITFNTSRLRGWGTTNSVQYVIIDDPDFSGSQTNPSLSDRTNPDFNGYTIEITNAATFTFSYTDKTTQESVSLKETVVPEKVTYGDTFSINNTKIVSDAMVFASKETVAAMDNIIIPKGITTIESKAFQNVPDSVTVKCEAEAKPEGWAADWCDATHIEFGYVLKGEETTGRRTGNETNQRTQQTGINTKYYGELVKSVSNATDSLFSIIDDVNYSGDIDNPLRSTWDVEAGAEYVKPYKLSGYVNLIDDVAANENIVIPEKLLYGTDLIVENKTIASKTLVFPKLGDNEVYTGAIKTITIPAGIEVVESGAFSRVPASVTIKCEAASKPAGWSDTWVNSGANVEWGVAVEAAAKTQNVANVDREFRLSNEADTYILGYKYTQEDKYSCNECGYIYEESALVNGKCPENPDHALVKLKDVTPEFYKPLVVYYEVVNKLTNSKRSVWYEMPLISEEPTSVSLSYFDSVKESALSRSFDILLEDNEEFDHDSVKVYNIYRSKTLKIPTETIDESGQKVVKTFSYIVPDVSVCFVASAKKRYQSEVNINQVITTEFSGLSQFAGYTMVSMNVNKVLPSYWKTGVSPDVASTYEPFLNDGTYSVRYCLYNLNNSFYRITYYSQNLGKETTLTIPIKTPNSVIVLDKESNNNVSFLLKNTEVAQDFSVETLRQFEIIGFTVNIHLWDNAKSVKIGRTDVSVHFGSLDVMPRVHEQAKSTNLNLVTVIFVAIYTVVFAIAAVALFFFLKNKYKNDEFRRMKPKQYVKSSIIAYVGSLIVALAILFVIYRTGVFSNAVSVHNPVDIFIVIPGIISIVVIGYFIKFLVGKIKSEKQRRKIIKLKLNEGAAQDDGTN